MSLETQRQLRENICETRAFVEELHQWQQDVRKRDAALRRSTSSSWTASPRDQRRRPVAEMELSASIGQTDDVTAAMHSTSVEPHSDPSAEAEKRREEGNVAFRREDFAQAIALYSVSLRIQPTSLRWRPSVRLLRRRAPRSDVRASVLPCSYANRAMAYLKREQFALAEADCDSALDLDPSLVKAYQRRSAARREQGKIQEALLDAEMALRYLPESDTIRATFHDLFAEIRQAENLGGNAIRQQIEIRTLEDAATPAETEIPVTSTEQPTPNVTSPKEPSPKPVEEGSDVTSPKEPPLKSAETSNVTSSTVKPEESDAEVLVGSVERKVALPVVPQTWAEFESGYKSLKNHKAWLRDYFGAIPPASLPTLFKTSLTAPILASFLEAVLSGLVDASSSVDWTAFATQLPLVPRYEMALMSLSSKHKASLKRQAQQLSTETQTELATFLKPFL